MLLLKNQKYFMIISLLIIDLISNSFLKIRTEENIV